QWTVCGWIGGRQRKLSDFGAGEARRQVPSIDMSAVVHDPLQSAPHDDRLMLAAGDPARTLAFVGGRAVSAATFLSQVRAVAALLPEAGHAVNLCQDRYLYLVAFCAVALRGQATLM